MSLELHFMDFFAMNLNSYIKIFLIMVTGTGKMKWEIESERDLVRSGSLCRATREKPRLCFRWLHLNNLWS